jgi:putative ABC transport system permease protein
MGVRGVTATLSRSAVAIAALMIAVATTMGVGIMIGSFREAVVRWLDGSLRADLYVSPPSLVGSRTDSTLDPAVVERLMSTPGVVAASTTRLATVQSPRGPVSVIALGLSPGYRPGFRLLQGGADEALRAFHEGSVLVSEPFAHRNRVRVGERLRLRTDQGQRDFWVGGIFYDYGSSGGTVVMSRTTYERFWNDRAISGLALNAAPGVDPDTLTPALRQRAAEITDGTAVVIRSNRALREASLQIFDRTFAITSVLRLLTVAVAFIGVLSALMAFQLERVREVGVLRALGLTPRQVWAVATAQTGVMGLLAGLLAVPVGLVLAFVLIFVINRRSFGWTMPMEVDPVILVQGVTLALAAALLAGLYPARRMAMGEPAEALRDE